MTRQGLASIPQVPYIRNYGALHTYRSQNRDHQEECLRAIATADWGQVISPCGTGKSRMQVCELTQTLVNADEQGSSAVVLVASHRLVLNKQLATQVIDLVIKCGIPFDLLMVGSDRPDLIKLYHPDPAVGYGPLGFSPKVNRSIYSLNKKEIENFVARARNENRSVIIVSTYHSVELLSDIGVIDLANFDEAHNLTAKGFQEKLSAIKPNILRGYYYTATRKVAGDDEGMNDFAFYGNIIANIKPQVMLTRGEIACPRIVLINSENDETTNDTDLHMLVKNTIEGFVKHLIRVKNNSCQPDDIGAKIIIACDGVQEMENIYQHADLMNFARASGVRVFGISSKGGCHIDGQDIGSNRETFFKELNSLTDKENALIFNVNILCEGFDLPSITGAMPLKNLGLTRLMQLDGRANRLHRLDRERLYAGTLKPGDYANYVKPYGDLIIPTHISSVDEHRRMVKYAKLFYSEFGIPPEELIIRDDEYMVRKHQELPSTIPFDFKGGKDYNLTEEVISIIEDAKQEIKQDAKNEKTVQLRSALDEMSVDDFKEMFK